MSDKRSLLLVDDEERILRSLSMLLRGPYEVLATSDPSEALGIVGQRLVHVVLSDQKMPRMRGVDLLRQVREVSPNTMRLLLTGYSELDSIVASVNEGEIFRFISKPWDTQELRATVAQAADIAAELFASGAPPAAADDAGILAQGAEGILVVDDDAEVIHAVREIIAGTRPVYGAQSLEQAFERLSRYRVGVVVSELTLGRQNISVMLKLLKSEYPEIVTIVMTSFQDTGVLIGLINQGQVFRFLPKPVRRGPLGMNLNSALRHHELLKASPIRRAAHGVEKPREPDDLSLSQRLLGVLNRFRSRVDSA